MKRLVTWADLLYCAEPGAYPFQDGVLEIERTHLEEWDRDIEGVWEVARTADRGRSDIWRPVRFHPSPEGGGGQLPITRLSS